MKAAGPESRNYTQAVLRACALVHCFRSEGEILVLADVMQRTGLSKTTAFRLLQSLVQGGLIERVGKGEYRCLFRPLAARPIRLGFAAQTDSPFCARGHRKPAARRDCTGQR